MLPPRPVALDAFDEDVANAIKGGTLRKGMTKEQVLLTRGYPPAHQPPSLDSDRWQYWSSRYVVHTLIFSQGQLVEGRGLF